MSEFPNELSAAEQLTKGHEGDYECDADGHVVHVALFQCGIDDSQMEPFRRLPYIQKVNLGDAQITNEGLACLAGCLNLRALDLWEVSNVTDLSVLSDCRQMEELTLAGLRDLTDAGMESVAGFAKLVILNAERSGIGDATVKRLQNCPKLKVLRLALTAVSDAGIASLGRCLDLEELDCFATAITDSGLQALASLSSLKSLNISQTGATIKSAVEFKSLECLEAQGRCDPSLPPPRKHASVVRSLPRLKTLNLKYTQLDEDSLDAIGGALGDLRSLELTGSVGVTDEGVTALATLKHLETLLLSYTPLGDRALGALAQLAKLKKLELAATQITDQGLRQLQPLGSLESLSVCACPGVSQDGVSRLQEMMPGLKCVDV